MREQFARSVLLGLSISAAGLSQTPPPANEPVQAELLANLNVRHLASGKTIFARVTLDWNGKDCVLRKGATLQGTVETSIPRVGKSESKLALSFDRAQCSGREMQQISLVLAAVAQPPSDWSVAPNAQFRMPMPISGSIAARSRGGTSTAQESGSLERDSPGDFQTTYLELAGVEHRFPVRANIRSGDVIDLKGIKLDLGTGPNLSSVLSSKSRDVSLSEFTQILLVPASSVSATISPQLASSAVVQRRGGNSVTRVAPAVAAIPPGNDLEVCAPPGCAVDLPVNTKELEGHKSSSIAIRPLGYAPRSNRVGAGFEDQEALAWLGQEKLLFAFNPHHLIRRGDALSYSHIEKVIRAVLLDTATRNIVRAVDWEISDSHRYLWQFDTDRILVHVGNELRLYGPDMEMQKSIPLTGPLLFLRIAPNGGLMAVATLRERHSPELHAQLRDELGSDPQEDVEIAILDKDFNTIGRASTVSDLMPPTLLNEGQVKLQSEPGRWYRLAMSTWENKRITLTRFRSTCTPEVTSAAPDLLFMLTCSVKDGNSEYWVLRADGKVLLRGVAGLREVGHETMGNDRSRTFAMKVVHAQREISPSTIFKSSDLESEEVRVYRVEDGKRLLAVQVKEPIPSHGGFALSPDGSELAVLSGSDIQFFPVPAR